MNNTDGWAIWVLICFSPLIIISVLDMYHGYTCFVAKILLKIDLYRICKSQFFDKLDKNDLEEVENIKYEIMMYADFPQYDWMCQRVKLMRIREQLRLIKRTSQAGTSEN